MEKILELFKAVFLFYMKLILWLFTLAFFALSITYFGTPTGFCALEITLLIAPIKKWQECIKLVIPKTWMKIVLIFVFFFMAMALA